MAKGKKQKPKKRVARRVDDELEQGGVGEGAEGGDEANEQLDEGADEAEGHEGADDAESDEPDEADEAPVAARAVKSEPEPKARSTAKSKDVPTELPVTQTSEKGPVVFLAVIGVLLAFAIAVGFLTN
jgi:hypothetical protein